MFYRPSYLFIFIPIPYTLYWGCEILIESNTVIDQDVLEKILEIKLDTVTVLNIDQLNHGSYIADTLRADSTQNNGEAVMEIYRVMRPGEPPTVESADKLFRNLFFEEMKLLDDSVYMFEK